MLNRNWSEKRNFLRFISLTACFFIFQNIVSGFTNKITLTSERYNYSLKEKILIYKDAASLDFETVRRFYTSGKFKPYHEASVENKPGVYWVRFEVENSFSTPLSFYIHHEFADYFDLYEQSGNDLSVQHGGALVIYSDKPVKAGFAGMLKDKVAAKSTRQVFIRIENKTPFASQLNREGFKKFNVLTAGGFDFTYKFSGYLHAFFFGGLFIMIFYNFFIFYKLRDRSYLYYVIYVAVMSAYFFCAYGYMYRFVLPDDIHLFRRVWVITAQLIFLPYAFFSRSFLDLKNTAPKFDLILRFSGSLLLIPVILVLNDYWIAGRNISVFLSITTAIIALAAGLYVFRQGYRVARYFLYANFVFLITSVLYALWLLAIIPQTQITRFIDYSTLASILVQLTLFSFGLADRFNTLKRKILETQLQQEKEIQNLVKEKNSELEQKVIERTAELKSQNEKLSVALEDLKNMQQQLIQVEKLASLGQLTSGIAHEIKNPLNFVNNFSQLTADLIDELNTTDSEEDRKEVLALIKDNIEKISQHGKRADQIVQSMLQHSRLEKDEIKLTDINALCKDYLEFAYQGMRANESGFTCEIIKSFDETLPPININPQDISRALLNILSNALYAVKKRSEEEKSKSNSAFKPSITLTTIQQKYEIAIKVKDNGTGIPEHIADKIFEPFFTTKPGGEGTGLGLSLSYDTIKAHGGTIRVNTEQGAFTEMIIYLPLK